MKLLIGVLAVACVPAAFAENNAPLPKENVTEFLAQKLDLTTLPPSLRPKTLKSKKTFGDYGYVAQPLDDKQILVEETPAGSRINVRVLEQNASSMYVCVRVSGQEANSGPVQRVVLLKLKNADGFLKARESWKEFDGCPVLGGSDSDSSSASYGG